MSDPRNDVIKKALTDPKFKAELIKNPKAAIEKALGVSLPAGAQIKVVEDSASVVHLVLPAAAEKGGKALSDAELASAAGGAGSNTIILLPGCQSTMLCYGK